jgi:hypothetical protein
MKLIAKALVLLSFSWVSPPLLLLGVSSIQPAQARQAPPDSYTRIDFPRRLSIEVPSDWKVSSPADRSTPAAAGSAMTASAGGPKGATGQKETLLTANSPDPVGAAVRLSVTVFPAGHRDDIASATPSDLKAMTDELLKQYRKLEASGGPQVIEMQPARLETIGGRRALVVSYRRASRAGPSPWQVVQYKIPLPDRLIELTLSHQESDAAVWRPVLEKVRRSLQF